MNASKSKNSCEEPGPASWTPNFDALPQEEHDRRDAEFERHCAEQDAQRKNDQIAAESHHRVLLFRASGIPHRHGTQKTDWTRCPEQKAAFDFCAAKIGTGVIFALCGCRGTGKTQIAAELIRAVTESNRRARYIRATEFFMEVKATYRADSEQDEGGIIDGLCDPSLLVIDEFHDRGGSAWENTLLTYLIDRRYGDMTDTVIIANVTQAELPEVVGPSVARRMNDGGGVIECEWKGVTGCGV